MLFVIPSPIIASPKMIPKIGPGITKTCAYDVIALNAGIIKMIPLTASNPDIKNDLFFHAITNAAVDNIIATRLRRGVGPSFVITATLPTAFVITIASVAAARLAANR